MTHILIPDRRRAANVQTTTFVRVQREYARALRLLLLLLLVLTAAGWIERARAADANHSAAQDSARIDVRRTAADPLAERVRTFSQALDLDPAQQVQVRIILQSQREEMQKVWSDPSVPAAYRVGATRSISEKSADRIRALLNDEQLKKYKLRNQARDATAGAESASVENWMNASKQR
jgi:hypothetical protein